jgi:hypothetical protein
MPKPKTISIAVAISVIVAAAAVLVALYATNVLVPRYRCANGACVGDYRGSMKHKIACAQAMYTNPSLIFNTNDPTLKDQGVTNGSGVLTLGYVDTSKLKAGDLITWDISATATTTADGNQVCLGGALVNTAAFFSALDTKFIWGDGPAPGQWPWNAGVFNHSFGGPMVDGGQTVINNSFMSGFATGVLNAPGVLFLGDLVETNVTTADAPFTGGPVGDTSKRCTSAASMPAVLNMRVKSAVIPANGIGPQAYLAFLWFTHTTADPITFSITKDQILFTSKPKAN